LKILIADSDIERRFEIKILLRNYEVVFKEVRNSFEMLKSVEEFEPDLIIIDYFIPSNHAYSALNKIKEENYIIPSFILVNKDTKVDFPKMEKTEVLLFPIEEKKFVERIEKLTGKKLEEKKKEEVKKKEIKDKIKVLLADDEDEIRLLIKTLLGKNYEIVEASNGEELVERIKSFKPDLIITDIIMPKLSGWKAIYKIRENPELKDIPVIFTSGLVRDKELYETLKPTGPGVFLLKPFSKNQLEEAIKKFFS